MEITEDKERSLRRDIRNKIKLSIDALAAFVLAVDVLGEVDEDFAVMQLVRRQRLTKGLTIHDNESRIDPGETDKGESN